MCVSRGHALGVHDPASRYGYGYPAYSYGYASPAYRYGYYSGYRPRVYALALAALFFINVLRWAPMARRSKRPLAKNRLLKKTVYVDGDKTTISVDEPFWTALQEIAANQSVRVSKLVTTIDRNREHANLSSAIRLYVLDYYQRSSRK